MFDEVSQLNPSPWESLNNYISNPEKDFPIMKADFYYIQLLLQEKFGKSYSPVEMKKLFESEKMGYGELFT